MFCIGVDLGGTNIAAGIVDEKGTLLRKDSVPTKAGRNPDEIIKDMAELCRNLIKEQNLAIKDIEYVGIATPGSADSERGIVVSAYNLGFSNYPLAAKLKEYLGVEKVLIENDANAAAKGEAEYGAARHYNDSVMITLGTGVGGGIILGKKIHSGFNFRAAELGHVVIELDGLQCSCGRKGCWETYSSATGLIRLTKKKMNENKDTLMWEMVDGDENKVSGRTAFDAMRKGDSVAKAVVDRYIYCLAVGIVNVINALQPEVIVIGGGICNEKEYLTKPLLEIVEEEQHLKPEEKRTIIKIAELGNDAGIIGAAMLGY